MFYRQQFSFFGAFLRHVLDHVIVDNLLFRKFNFPEVVDLHNLIGEFSNLCLQLLDTLLIFAGDFFNFLVFELEDGFDLILFELLLFALEAEVLSGHFMHFDGLFFGKAVLDDVDLSGLDHVQLVLLFIQEVNFLDKLLNFHLVLLELFVGVIDELILLLLDFLQGLHFSVHLFLQLLLQSSDYPPPFL